MWKLLVFIDKPIGFDQVVKGWGIGGLYGVLGSSS